MKRIRHWDEDDQTILEVQGHAAHESLVLRLHQCATWSDVAVVLEEARDQAKRLAVRDYEARCRHELPMAHEREIEPMVSSSRYPVPSVDDLAW